MSEFSPDSLYRSLKSVFERELEGGKGWAPGRTLRAEHALPGEVFVSNVGWWPDTQSLDDVYKRVSAQFPGLKLRFDAEAAVDDLGYPIAGVDEKGTREMTAAVYVSLP